MVKIQVDDIQINYESRGNGFPLLMIHGLSENLLSWDPNLIQGLSEEYKLILFDIPGSGNSGLPDKELSIRLLADETIRLLDVLGYTKVNVLGVSMGGMIAQELILNYAERIRKMVLCSTHCGRPKFVPPSLEVIQQINQEELSPQEMIKNILKALFSEKFLKENPDYVQDYINRRFSIPISKEGLMEQQKASMSFSSCDRLHSIKSPILILHGKKDIMVPPQNASILAEIIPNSKLRYLENSAHFLAEEVDQLLKYISDFLK